MLLNRLVCFLSLFFFFSVFFVLFFSFFLRVLCFVFLLLSPCSLFYFSRSFSVFFVCFFSFFLRVLCFVFLLLSQCSFFFFFLSAFFVLFHSFFFSVLWFVLFSPSLSVFFVVFPPLLFVLFLSACSFSHFQLKFEKEKEIHIKTLSQNELGRLKRYQRVCFKKSCLSQKLFHKMLGCIEGKNEAAMKLPRRKRFCR